MQNYFYSFNNYLREKFGERVHRISIDAGFGCPNIDGTKSKDGCVYCNNKGFVKYLGTKSIEEQINNSILFYQEKMRVKKFIAYFQAFSNTYADIKTLKEKYDIIKKFPQIVGLFISTRPDCVDEEKISLISDYSKNYLVWIEYGLQTTHNHILEKINRNHTYEDFLEAYKLTRKFGINVGIHLIFGLPYQTYDKIMEDAERLSKLDIQGIKFHALHILKDTQIESLYRENKIKLLTIEEYVRIFCDFLERIPKNFVVLRVISSAQKEYLIAPSWINDKNIVLEKINEEFKKRNTFQGFRIDKQN